ncbi:MAG: DNA-binding transcriptional regulator [Clostridia bacterium]|nr:DNA-binding transcriptional regulator [Clostridia bacterium]MBQ8716848.1 DNA-binding transcriptional regulator [Clostridia bacterium]
MDALHTPEVKRFYRSILDLKTEQDCASFFEDICTIKELQDIAQRLEVAFMLHEGKNYQEISLLTGASTATISRVKKCLVYGSGGYRNAVDRAMERGEIK